jgi:hypothetical protein
MLFTGCCVTSRVGLVWVVVLAAFAGCVVDVDTAGDDFVAPVDTRENVDLQGVYDCTERGDTGYRQGDDFAIRVVNVDGKPIEVNTANAYLALQSAARADGVSLRIVSGFRTMSEQEYFYSCYTNCNCNNCNLAARPGYSNHQSGHALDLNTGDNGVLRWLNNNGAAFGWSRTVPSEDWHWEWWGGATDYPGPCGTPPVPAACESGSYSGAFCDDDDTGSEAAHNCLATTLDVDFACDDVAGSPAFCGDHAATRADALYVLATAAGVPLTDVDGAAFADAFVDDNGHAYERTLNAGHHFGLLLGDGAGHANPNGAATRSTVAVLLTRIYGLPPADRDFFSDDDGSDAEDAHNRVAALGFTFGCGAGDGDRRRFCGSDPADRSALARFACGTHDFAPTAIWERPVVEEPVDPVDEEPVDPVDEEPVDEEPVDEDIVDEDVVDEDVAGRRFAPSVVRDDGCAQTGVAGAPVALTLLALLTRRRRPTR